MSRLTRPLLVALAALAILAAGSSPAGAKGVRPRRPTSTIAAILSEHALPGETQAQTAHRFTAYVTYVALLRWASYVQYKATLDFAAAVEHAQQRPAGPGPGIWDRLAQCEASGDWAANTGNGYYGGLQWLTSTFHAYGGRGRPDHASRGEQIVVAERVLAGHGDSYRSSWPACSRHLGLP